MDPSISIRTFSLALSLLRHSSPPSQSFVLSPFSLNSALSIIHDGADGVTQLEITNLLLNGSSPNDVTAFYSSLARSLESNNTNEVSVTSANRFYLDEKILLKNAYQNHVEDKYGVKVQNIDMTNTKEAAREMNNFMKEATNGKITDVVKPREIIGSSAFLINTIDFTAQWRNSFWEENTRNDTFHAENGDREMEFMIQTGHFLIHFDDEFGTALIMPYQDENYSFFYLMPNESSNLETMRKILTGDILFNILNETEIYGRKIIVPTFKIESKLEASNVLEKMGVSRVFNNGAELSKISSTPLHISSIKHNVVIENNEFGTSAAAATVVEMDVGGSRFPPRTITINRPFLFGILKEQTIMFIGQFA